MILNHMRLTLRELKQFIADIMEETLQLDEEYMGFKKLKGKLSHQKGVHDPGALAASIGRKKYGKKGMARKAAVGRKKKK